MKKKQPSYPAHFIHKETGPIFLCPSQSDSRIQIDFWLPDGKRHVTGLAWEGQTIDAEMFSRGLGEGGEGDGSTGKGLAGQTWGQESEP